MVSGFSDDDNDDRNDDKGRNHYKIPLGTTNSDYNSLIIEAPLNIEAIDKKEEGNKAQKFGGLVLICANEELKPTQALLRGFELNLEDSEEQAYPCWLQFLRALRDPHP